MDTNTKTPRTDPRKDRSAPHILSLGLVLTAALLLLPALAACDSVSPSEATPVQTASAPADARADLTPVQMREILALKARWDAAWAAKDAAAYASIYAEDAQFVSPVGGVVSGRATYQSTHVFLFNGPFAGSTSVSEIRRATFLTGSIVMVDLDVAVSGYQFLPPGLVATEPGVFRTRIKWVVAKQRGTWEVIAQQVTAVAPPPPAL
jgi:uncharacterized protein (TIGR02246 family)